MTKLTGAFHNYVMEPNTNTDVHWRYTEQNESDKSKTRDCVYSNVSYYCSTDSLYHRVPKLVHILDLGVFIKSWKAPISFVTCVRPSVRKSSERFLLGRLPWKVTMATFHENLSQNPNLVKIGHFTLRPKYFIVTGAIKSPWKRSL